MNVEILILLLITIYSLYILRILFLHAGTSANRKIIGVFIALVFTVLVWVLSIFLTEYFKENYFIALTSSRISFVSSIIISFLYFYFVKAVGHSNSKLHRVELFVLVPLSILALIASVTSGVVKDVHLINSSLRSTNGDLYIFVALFMFAVFVYSTLLFYRYWRYEINPIFRAQKQYILVGASISIFLTLVTNIIIPYFLEKEYRSLGPLTLVFFLGFTTYAIARYRFSSIRVLLGKFLKLILISLFTYFCFYFVVWGQEQLWGSLYTQKAFISGAFIALVFMAMVQYSLQKLEVFVEKYVANEVTFLTVARDQYNNEISKELNVDHLIDVTISSLNNVLDSSDSTIWLLDEKKQHSSKFNDSEDVIKTIYRTLVVGTIFIREEAILFNDNLGKNEIERINLLRNLKVGAVIKFKGASGKGLMLVGEKSTNSLFTLNELEFIKFVVNNFVLALDRTYYYAELLNLTNELKGRVKEATHELHEKIYALNESRRKEHDMIDIMAHELRTPMTAIKSYYYLLEKIISGGISKFEPKDVSKFEKYNSVINKSIEQELELINTFLQTARTDSNRLPIDKKKANILEVFHQVVDKNLPFADLKGLKLNLKISRSINSNAVMFVDPDRILEVLNNFVNNALKYTEDGSVTIDISIENKNLLINISDTGIGIPKNEIKNLGRKFYRIDQYSYRDGDGEANVLKPGGTGLGLYVSYGIIKLHNGTVEVESKEGKGTIFTITLPL